VAHINADRNIFPIIFPVTCHTDHVGPDTTFVAIKGFKDDGASYIAQALARGATQIVVQKDAIISDKLLGLLRQRAVMVQYVENTRKVLSALSAQAAGYPARKLRIIGITGTKGKTTTSFLLRHILLHAGHRTALLSTVSNYIDDIVLSAPLTTAQPDYLHQFLKLCVERGITHVVMEVAAQALTLYRVHGIEFDNVIFTNFGQEHLEFYDNLESYFAAKCSIFNQRKLCGKAYVNADDERCKILSGQYGRIETFGLDAHAYAVMSDINVRNLTFRLSINGQNSTISCPGLSGSFNAYNITAAICIALEYGISPDQINSALQSFRVVPGRFESYTLSNGALAVIDYAHNPLSYQALLPELRALTDHLIVVFGAGGDRDASRRPIMGLIVSQYADLVFITSDNPRTEKVDKISEDIYVGVPEHSRDKIIMEFDREQAIKKAFSFSRNGTVIALLGKGTERYQIIGTEKIPFSEPAILAVL